MSCEHLICASCAGPVAEGRCPVCRAAKSDLHRHGHGSNIQYAVILLLLAIAVALAVQHLAH
jgi:predicted DCC family thiol-disulfide oxidoreductase YuxK